MPNPSDSYIAGPISAIWLNHLQIRSGAVIIERKIR